MHLEKFKVDKIQNGRLSAIIKFWVAHLPVKREIGMRFNAISVFHILASSVSMKGHMYPLKRWSIFFILAKRPNGLFQFEIIINVLIGLLFLYHYLAW